MGGASQGNQGISFGGRRQITSAGPHVPNAAEKERKRREKAAEEDRIRVLAEEAEIKRRVEREAEEERQRLEEERLWEEEARKQREAEQLRLEKQKREWEEQERRWKLEEEQRLREEREAEERLEKETRRKRAGSDARLKGQYLSEYQAEHGSKPRSRRNSQHDLDWSAERERVRELERQLEEAKERERLYQLEREERLRDDERRKARSRSKSRTRERSKSRPRLPPRPPSPQDSQVSWANADDREYLRSQKPRPLPDTTLPRGPSTRPLPEPSPRPLPDPVAYAKANRTDRFLASNPAPVPPKPARFIPPELTSTSERAAEDARRAASQTKTKAGGWAAKSIIEREMEADRQKAQELEESRQAMQNTPRDPAAGSGEGQSWDVNQYGYMGGDSQNKVGTGIGFGGRRQILGPRPFGPR